MTNSDRTRAPGSAWVVPGWSAPTRVRAVVTTRQGPGSSLPPFDRCNLGLRSGDDPEVVTANRASVAAALALPSAPCWLQQVHGCEVAVIGTAPVSGEPVADAAVTREPGRSLAILTADCLPVLFCDLAGEAVAAAHAGWRGLAAGVLEQTVAAMGAPPARVVAWLGPCIGAPSYEVGEDVREAFLARDADCSGCFAPTRPGHWLCDLAGLARRTLQATGVGRIDGGGFDTFTDARFYSYRRDGARSGRFASLIWLDEA
ncbi:peptidoglycan editing factor PgeF [Dyella ginsengisoli]|uniref:peptidoglycan editing factor PgeF n=1 Tax=Dyella ginsengisoli TaxID=363848 RepID=UPI00069336F3|nr:peptidoglycan editing factor PgeF [Dyella ginsengisoli]